MKSIALALAFVLPTLPACASTSAPEPSVPEPVAKASQRKDDSWKTFGYALTLAQVMTRIAAHSDNPEQGFDDVLAGRNIEANRAVAGLLEDATSGMPSEHRSRVNSIGQDIALLARKEVAKPNVNVPSPDRALQARKDLTAMGLKYHDPNEFFEAVKRDDALAVELFIEGRGVNVGAKDKDGRSALEIARARGNEPMAQLLARNLRAAR
jgi:hypothetical protein